MSRRSVPAAVLAVIALLVAGCTGVPTESLPQTIESVGVGQQSPAAGGPTRDAPPIKIVKDFLSASTNDPVKHSTAREYLTPAARNRWLDTTVTIIANEKIGTYDTARGTVTVTGSKVGSLDGDGVYTPTLDGTGHGGAIVPFVFAIEVDKGQNRISALNAGLLLTEQQFRSFYPQRTLYRFDAADRYLVPDPRYSPLIDANQISGWMIDQLVQEPPPSLAGVVNTDPLAAAQSQRISVKISAASTTVQIPGSRQLGPDVRDRLAAQVSTTLDRAFNVGEIRLVDGDRKVLVPQVGRTEFSAADFIAQQGPPGPSSQVFYLRDGRIRTQSGALLSGPLGDGAVRFDSVALARPTSIGALAVAGVQKMQGGTERLVVGTQNGGVRGVSLPAGRLTRPAWFPNLAEVWVGGGAALYRVTTNGHASKVVQVPIPSVSGGGPLVAVRPSPDGSRVALVVQGVNNRPQLYVAGVVRTGQTVQVENATLVSPSGAVVTDVAWIDPLKLYAIGYLVQSTDSQVYRVNVDGASWTNDGIGTLPNPPDSITMADGAAPWVSADSFVWDLNGGDTWVSPVVMNGQTPGDNPIYLG